MIWLGLFDVVPSEASDQHGQIGGAIVWFVATARDEEMFVDRVRDRLIGDFSCLVSGVMELHQESDALGVDGTPEFGELFRTVRERLRGQSKALPFGSFHNYPVGGERPAVSPHKSLDYGPAILDSLRSVREALGDWRDRAEPCGLLVGQDEPVGYGNIPDNFRAFASWGVDGVHEGFWIDDRHQAYQPFIVMASPMDSESMSLMAANAEAWLERVHIESVDGFTDEAEERFGTRARSRRRELNLKPIPSSFDNVAIAMSRFEDRYRSVFAELGLALEASHRVASDELPTLLPAALRAYYELAGRHPINFAHNQLGAPEALDGRARRLVFMTENQGDAEWAVETLDADDPMVFQGVHNPDGSTGWYSEDLRFSAFITAMLRWTVTGEEPGRDQ